MVPIDLQKVFDTINHLLLLEKMTFLGFSEKTIKWTGNSLFMLMKRHQTQDF